MKRSERDGKVFIDWSQNNGAKTTISPYSLRGRDRPMVAAPRTWEELADPDLAQLDYTEVLERIREQPDPMAAMADPEAPGSRASRRTGWPPTAACGTRPRPRSRCRRSRRIGDCQGGFAS